jgi:beta-galactosidase
LEEDGKVLQEGEIVTDVKPLSKKMIRIPYTKPEIKPDTEYRLTVSSYLKENEIWAQAGHEVAWDQLDLPWHKTDEKIVEKTTSQAKLNQTETEILVSGANFTYTFNKQGSLVSIRINNKEILKSPFKLNVWRAPLANEQDQWGSGNARSGNWKTGFGEHVVTEFYSLGIDSLTHYPLAVEAFELNGKVHLNVRDVNLLGSSNSLEKKDLYIWGVQTNGFECLYSYTIDGEGVITIQHQIMPQGKMPVWLPRIGLTFTLDKSMNHVKWYGRGPQENYPDRKTGYKTGIYQSTVAEMYEPYLIPQDYGLRTDNRWVTMTDETGNGLRLQTNDRFNFNAYPYSTDNLTKAMFTYQLQEQDGITFNLDYATSGVGCTARSIFNSYRVFPQMYERKVIITPVKR